MSQMYLRPRGRGAPFACGVTVSTGGSGWPAGPVSFLVGAWYSAGEHDFTQFVPLNWAWQYAGASLTQGIAQETALHNVAAAPNSSFAFTWSRPSGRQPDHYSIYWMAGPTFASLSAARKVLPGSGLINGNIPGNATSALILSAAPRTQSLTVPVVATHASGVHVPGNRTMSFTPTSTVTLSGVTGIANGTYSVSTASVKWTADGPVTQLTLAGVSGVAPATQSGTCQYDCGPLCLRLSGDGGYRPLTYISLENALELSADSACEPDFTGRLQPVSFASGQPYRRIAFDVAYGGLGTGDSDSSAAPGREPGGLSRLNAWARAGVELELVDEGDWSSAAGVPSSAQLRYFGALEHVGHPGSTRRWGDSYRFALRVDGIRRSDDERGWFTVQAVTSGSGGSFEIDGDETAAFSAGTPLHVFGSTGNDMPYCVASSSYDAPSNRTRIVVTGNVPSAVVDGRVEVQDW